MYVTIEYPNYSIISLLTQPGGNYMNVTSIYRDLKNKRKLVD